VYKAYLIRHQTPKAKVKNNSSFGKPVVEMCLSFITAFSNTCRRGLEGPQEFMDVSYAITSSIRFKQMPSKPVPVQAPSLKAG